LNRERLPWRLVYRVALVAAAIITLSAVPGVGAHAGDPEGPISGVRVPAEWELQEAIWLQWPGRFEKVYEPAFAEIVNVVTKYQRLHILHGSSATSSHARAAITAAGGDPDHPNITYHQIPNDGAWMRARRLISQTAASLDCFFFLGIPHSPGPDSRPESVS